MMRGVLFEVFAGKLDPSRENYPQLWISAVLQKQRVLIHRAMNSRGVIRTKKFSIATISA
jgi:hypothetical protein